MQERRWMPHAAGRLAPGALSRLALAAGFCALIFLPLLAPPDAQNTEKRTLAPRPSLSWESLATFPKRYEGYFNDHFGFRQALIRAHSWVQVRVLRVSPLKKLVLGRRGWFYYDEGAASGAVPFADFRGRLPWSEKRLEKTVAKLRAQRDWLAGMGVPFVVIVCPNKETIYPEHLPAPIARRKRPTRLDRLAAALAGESVLFVDPRRALRDAKDRGHLFFKTDTHWNTLGGFFGYRELIDALRRELPRLSPLRLEDFSVRFARRGKFTGDLAVMLSLEGILEERVAHLRPRPRTAGGWKAGKVLVFHDSFVHGFAPLLPRHFREVVMHTGRFDYRVVLREKPDVVILEVVERSQDILAQGIGPPAGRPAGAPPPPPGPAPAAPRG